MHPLSDKALSLETYRSGRYMTFDFETTNIEFGSPLIKDNRIVLTAWKLSDGKVQHHVGNILECKQFWADLEAADYLVAHNVKFDAGWLLRLGYDPTDKLWADTLLAEYVRLGNRQEPLNLGAVSERYGYKGKEELIDTMMKAGICPSEMPEKRLVNRCRRDVLTTAQIWRRQLEGLDKTNRLGVLLTRCLLAPILAHIEATGMCLDAERVRSIYDEYAAKLADIRREIDKFTGGINPNSSAQVAVFLYQTLKFPEPKDFRGKPKRNKPSKQFPDGAPKVDKNTMEWLKGQAKTKRQKQWIELRETYGQLNAAMTKNLEFFKGVVEERADGIFYGQFNQAVTGTHRLSSTGRPQKFNLFPKPKSVQFQNMPRIFKKLFKSRDPDYWMVDADASQLEFRVAADLGDDTQAKADISSKADIHRYTASVLNDCAEEDVTKDQRQEAKPDTFKPLYGGTKGTPAQERYYAAFQQKYHEIYAAQERWVSEVICGVSDSRGEPLRGPSGRLVTPWGMRFYWNFHINKHGTPIDKRSGKPVGPQIFNYPVQSFATAEIVPIAIVHLFHRCKREQLRVRFCNTVHDSAPCEVHKEDFEQYKQLAVKAFTEDVYAYLEKVYGYEFKVPLGCEIVNGTHWGQGDEFSVDIEPKRKQVNG